MPFTFSHPAIVLPLRRQGWVSFPALVWGSMAPDLEYFLRMQPYSVYSHTLPGLFCVDLPLVIALYVVYRYVVAKGLLAVFWHAFFVKGVSPLIHPLRQVVPFLSGSLLGICLLAPLVNGPGVKK
ncbi:DUF4184 family protein [Brevibacillus sp. SAFN-007a]|uniref:DUF4184 family protein n=1 Tax=Brevibacillus sp. SAFN-007a TaxID=3436862 RepID=UPI003F813631